jgi:hypothetical protein
MRRCAQPPIAGAGRRNLSSRPTVWQSPCARAASWPRRLQPARRCSQINSSQGKRRCILSMTNPAPSRSGLQPSGRRPASAALRCRPGRGSCGPSPSCRRRNPPHRLCRPFFRRFHRLAVGNRGRRAGLAAHSLTQCDVQLDPDRLPCSLSLELAEDVEDVERGGKPSRGR